MFFVLAFAGPWFVWGSQWAHQEGLITWQVPGALAFWIGLPLATFGTAAMTGRWPAVRDVLARMVRARQSPLWWVIAMLAVPAIAAIAIGVGVVLGARPSLGPVAPLAVLGAFLFNVWMWLWTEEAAWRGFALPRMVGLWGPVRANLALGLVWAMWHLPLFALVDSFQSTIPFWVFALSTMSTSLLIGWVWQSTRGSVAVAAVLHASADVTISTTGVMTSGPLLLGVFVGLQAVLGVLALVLIARGARRLEGAPTVTPS
jgi:membrane protease YdiL (CAAX protease family)